MQTDNPKDGKRVKNRSIEVNAEVIGKLKKWATKTPIRVHQTLLDKALGLHEVTHILYREKGMSYSQIAKWYKDRELGGFTKIHIGRSLQRHDQLTNP
jgi:hypothetical protein